MSRGNSAIEEVEEVEEKDVEGEKSLTAPEEAKEEREAIPEEDIFPFGPELLEEAPPELRRAIKIGISMMRMAGPVPHPLASAVAKVLDGGPCLAERRRVRQQFDIEGYNLPNRKPPQSG